MWLGDGVDLTIEVEVVKVRVLLAGACVGSSVGAAVVTGSGAASSLLDSEALAWRLSWRKARCPAQRAAAISFFVGLTTRPAVLQGAVAQLKYEAQWGLWQLAYLGRPSHKSPWGPVCFAIGMLQVPQRGSRVHLVGLQKPWQPGLCCNEVTY
jgi:hypothetical protein